MSPTGVSCFDKYSNYEESKEEVNMENNIQRVGRPIKIGRYYHRYIMEFIFGSWYDLNHDQEISIVNVRGPVDRFGIVNCGLTTCPMESDRKEGSLYLLLYVVTFKTESS